MTSSPATITATRYNYGEKNSVVEITLPGRTEAARLGGARSDRAEAAVVAFDSIRGEWFVQGLRGSMAAAQSEARRWTEGRVQMPGARRGTFCRAIETYAVEVLDK